MTTALHQLPAIVLAFITLAALLAIGALIWQALPRRNARERDIERQIATLRKSADHAVATRPRVQKSTKRRTTCARHTEIDTTPGAVMVFASVCNSLGTNAGYVAAGGARSA